MFSLGLTKGDFIGWRRVDMREGLRELEDCCSTEFEFILNLRFTLFIKFHKSIATLSIANVV